MTLDFSRGYARDTLQVASDNRNEQIDRWFKNRSIKAWKKALAALYRYEEMTTGEIATRINVSMSITYRRLKKHMLDSTVHGETKNNKLIWHLTDSGVHTIYKLHKNKLLPDFLFGR